ncbi:unnamed protein product [Litomosoides sigmodontis]|uniref:FYVE, RhoGEF and PH domain-containing protein 4 n=1 Tax=Litomosoides sigmodontis TaxID=42156 RepID=A0A3P6URY8_LITSI|nr:unnamed protein product [Litomosoides sigmodontis]
MASVPDGMKKLSPSAGVDLQGGTLLDIKEFDEVDETDGCKVHVTEYHILSADGQEEMTKTCRRKLKIECNQSTRKTEIANGREALIEEKTERLFGDIDGFRQPIVFVDRSKTLVDFSNPEDSAISAVLQKTQEKFLSMLNEQKDQLVNMFPELFSEMRTSSSLSNAPQTEVETVVNSDGSTTTRMRSSRAYSTRFSKHEMYVNGVKQESKSKFRAFMEYKGPDGGFKVKLRDTSGDDDLSEEEEADDVNDDAVVDVQSQISEIPDTQSVMITGGSLNRVSTKEKIMKRTEKAWLAAKELVDSEKRYVDKLHLLDETFRKRIYEEKILGRERMTQLFSNISCLHQFHDTHLLPALMESSRDWHTTHRISYVLRKRAPFLKMYSEYTNNYKQATTVFNDCLRKKRRFARIVREIERTPECENLPLISHLICPVQREYKKHLDPSDADYEDTVAALELVLDAASHANEMMRKLDHYKNVLEVQEQIGSALSLVSPNRELIRKGKILSSSEKTEERHLFLFNDLILLASERTLPGFAKLKVRAIFDAKLAQICEGDNLERENSFYLRGSDSPTGPSRRVELMTETSKEKSAWIDAMWNVISESLSRSNSFSEPIPIITSPRSENRCCATCDVEFSFISRGTVCAHCAQRFCKKCFGKLRRGYKAMRICNFCLRHRGYSQPKENQPKTRTNPLSIGAKEGEILNASYVKFRGSMNKRLQRYFVVRKDFCLYSYASDDADSALAMLPLPGCQVKMNNERFTFTIKHMQRQYIVTVDSEDAQIKWMAVLDLASNAVLREKIN